MKKTILTLLLTLMSFSILSAEETLISSSNITKTNKHNLSVYLGNDNSEIDYEDMQHKVTLEKGQPLSFEVSYLYGFTDRFRLGLSLKTTGNNKNKVLLYASQDNDSISSTVSDEVKTNILGIVSLSSEYDFLKLNKHWFLNESKLFAFADVGYGLYAMHKVYSSSMVTNADGQQIGGSSANVSYETLAPAYSIGIGYAYNVSNHIKLATKVSYNDNILDAKMNNYSTGAIFHPEPTQVSVSSKGYMKYMFGVTYAF